MANPSFEDARRLAEWEPPLGVVSVYLRFDPGDRGGAWRTELRNGLAGLPDARDALDHGARTALRATARRVAERFANHEHDLPRGEVGFVEVAAAAASQRWWSTHLSPDTAATACFAQRPVVAPLLCLVERGVARGVALVSAERVRLLEWAPGRLEQLESWELSVFSRDWRERKAQRVPDPARGQAVSASGRDQFDDRLADNRHRFLRECRGLALRVGAKRGWPELLVFGPPQHAERFREGPDSSSPALGLGGEVDLISSPPNEIEAPVEEAAARRDADRHHELVEHALGETRAGMRGTAGARETLAALCEGRVEQLVIDIAHAGHAVASPIPPDDADVDRDGRVNAELLVRRALASGAGVTTVSGEPAELLEPAGGVAAVLRY